MIPGSALCGSSPVSATAAAPCVEGRWRSLAPPCVLQWCEYPWQRARPVRKLWRRVPGRGLCCHLGCRAKFIIHPGSAARRTDAPADQKGGLVVLGPSPRGRTGSRGVRTHPRTHLPGSRGGSHGVRNNRAVHDEQHRDHVWDSLSPAQASEQAAGRLEGRARFLFVWGYAGAKAPRSSLSRQPSCLAWCRSRVSNPDAPLGGRGF